MSESEKGEAVPEATPEASNVPGIPEVPVVSDEVTSGPEFVGPDPEARPWHGSDSPLEALYQFFMAEIAKLRGSGGRRGG